MMQVGAMVSRKERVAAAKRTSEALLSRAKRGKVAGGKTFGYDNVRDPKTKIVDLVSEKEAEVVRTIFERAAEGGSSGWDPGTLRAVLERPLYRGEMIYGRTKKRDKFGRKRATRRPPSEWTRVERPDLLNKSWR
jgi:hypothetical protein